VNKDNENIQKDVHNNGETPFYTEEFSFKHKKNLIEKINTNGNGIADNHAM
jgi:hypothetical protein